MNLNEVLIFLESQSNPSRKKTLIKAGASINTYGVLLGTLRKYAAQIGINHILAKELWKTHNTDARLLAIMLFDVDKLTIENIINDLESIDFVQVLDDYMFRVIKDYKLINELQDSLKKYRNDLMMRAYWAIYVIKIEGQLLNHNEIDELITIITNELIDAKPHTQWMMNRAFATIGIKYENYRENVLKISEKLGVYKDMKVSKGCTSAYVPSWINAVIKNNK
ncbi:DNA alkylation repair protein [Acholeplasma granularum]|uniref:DNA alkylation repair protein n=1 Tax=Acholeplasma granularum TaxID=264635 RepID=UPI000470059F|nr:DNA alkylation repair protein [Acholeplasma granularum]